MELILNNDSSQFDNINKIETLGKKLSDQLMYLHILAYILLSLNTTKQTSIMSW